MIRSLIFANPKEVNVSIKTILHMFSDEMPLFFDQIVVEDTSINHYLYFRSFLIMNYYYKNKNGNIVFCYHRNRWLFCLKLKNADIIKFDSVNVYCIRCFWINKSGINFLINLNWSQSFSQNHVFLQSSTLIFEFIYCIFVKIFGSYAKDTETTFEITNVVQNKRFSI